MTSHFKICCIKSRAELQCAIDAGAHAIGLVTAMPSGPGVISDDVATMLTTHVPDSVMPFLLTSRTQASDLIAQARSCHARCLQLVDHVRKDQLGILKSTLPHVKLVQVLHVEDETTIERARAIEASVDMILLDSGNPSAGELGGTGRVHNWQISAEIVRQCQKPVWLAGGLKAENVEMAIQQVRPYGVDLCSSVRTDDRLDAEKLALFVAAVERANRSSQ